MKKLTYQEKIVEENGMFLTMSQGKISTSNRSTCGKKLNELKTKYPDCLIYALAGAKRRYQSMGYDIYFYATPINADTIGVNTCQTFVRI